MKIQIQGVCNARDLGGIQTKFGKIQSGRLFRSGELSRMTAEGEKNFEHLGIRRIVDLRTVAEISSTPDVLPKNVDYVNISVLRATTFGITYEKSSGEEIAVMLQAGFERMKARGESYGEHMELLYRRFVNDDHSRQAYGKFLRLLAEKPVVGTLWHCTAGKDRCGTCAALLLLCLGADEQAIFEDYMLTNEQSRENKLSILNKVRGHVSEENLLLIQRMLEVDESYLKDFFAEIDDKFGNINGFLTACGVTSRHVEMLRENYIAPNAIAPNV